MYISTLMINIGDDPDHPRPGRLWVRNLYRVHQRLCMAFPSNDRVNKDIDFLQPFKPADFADGQVHVERKENAGFLFRVDPLLDNRVMIIIQSALQPDWDYAFHNADYLLAAPPKTRVFEPDFNKNDQLQFRLLANPVKKLSINSTEKDGRPIDHKWIGKRIPVPDDQFIDWLSNRAELSGFSIDNNTIDTLAGYVYVMKPDKHNGNDINENIVNNRFAVRYRSCRFNGMLTVNDPDKFKNTLYKGIGSAKSFGFGLLSVK
jgi:CRISPR system Cascade subunit CasE